MRFKNIFKVIYLLVLNIVLLLNDMMTTLYKKIIFVIIIAIFNLNLSKTIISHRIEIFLTYNVSFRKKLFDGDF